MRKVKQAISWVVLNLWMVGAMAEPVTHHQLQVTLSPASQTLQVVDKVTFPTAEPQIVLLHAGLQVQAITGSLRKLDSSTQDFAVPVTAYELKPQTNGQLTLQYQGKIHHPLPEGDGDSPAFLGPEGVYLGASSVWYPMSRDGLLTFDLDVTLPERWRAVSQGRQHGQQEKGPQWRTRWSEKSPQQEIFLIAAPFYQFSRTAGDIQVMAYLRDNDPALASRYLDVTADYVKMYETMIGRYPYDKFALVENFWSTGYGMPSFTLLGSDVIRLPFILYTSYPHEILHNWWGNSVYVDYDSGNWAEGLTSYLADHLLQEMRQEGVSYRRDSLQAYADFVDADKDFSLNDFRTRHSNSSQAVGYGKGQMLFHMLRRELGDDTFKKGLQKFYAERKFTVASYDDIEKTFSAVSNRDLKPYFQQWVGRVGAPKLALSKVSRIEVDDEWKLYFTLEQVQDGDVYDLNIPLAVTLKGESSASQQWIHLNQKEQQFVLTFAQPPVRVDIDPQFDIFRRADLAEIPAALSLAFGASTAVAVLPFAAEKDEVREYHNLVSQWRMQGLMIDAVYDNEIKSLPTNKTVWVLGWQNKFVDALNSGVAPYGADVSSSKVTLAGQRWNSESQSVVLVQRNPADPKHAWVWLAAHDVSAIAGLARKVPHYRKFSYLMFEGNAPENKVKGQWQIKRSPLSVSLDDDAVMGQLAPRVPLIE